MAAFVGYVVQSNGITWPGYCSLPNQNGGEFWLGVPGDKVLPELSFGDFAGMNPVEQWAAFPSVGTVQILFFISAIESFTEYQQPHYTSPECDKIGSFKTFSLASIFSTSGLSAEESSVSYEANLWLALAASVSG